MWRICVTSKKRKFQLHFWTDDGTHVRCWWDGSSSWQVTVEETGEHLCHVFHEGAQFVSSSHPGKKWPAIRQAVQYTLTMRQS